MIRKLSLAVLCAATLCHTAAFSATEHIFPQTLYYPFTLLPNEPQIYTNTMYWTIKSKCKIISESPKNPFSLTVLRKTGSLNGVKLSRGDSLDVIVNAGDSVFITADSGGRVELTNKGKETITARCENTN